MFHRRTPSPPSRTAKGVRRVTLGLLMLVVVLGGVPLRARAALVQGDWNNGNGKNNRNNFSINSPDNTRGNQHIANQNVGGANPAQTASCKRKFRHCHISQRIAVWAP